MHNVTRLRPRRNPEEGQPPPSIEWCVDPEYAEELMRFFVAQVPGEYSAFSGRPPRILDYEPWDTSLRRNIHSLAERIRSNTQPCADCDTNLVSVAKRGDTLLGLMIVSFRCGANPHVVLEDLVVASEYRGDGVAEALFSWVETEARRLGFLSWYLETGVDNLRAQRFFEKRGFKPKAVIMELHRPL